MQVIMSRSRLLTLLACALIVLTGFLAQPKPAKAQEGALIGGAIGMGVGAAVTRGRAGGVIGGALIGGVVGNQIQKNNRNKKRKN
jgi:osmotically inducible lipoprotein OsmB